MEAYINGIGNISPQNTLDSRIFPEFARFERTKILKCIHPDYKDFIDMASRRRMGNIVKLGITSAILSLRDAGIDMPDAIITCTGLGAVEDTEKFLNAMLDQEEKLLNPATFIQTTYNTVSSLIAIRLNCNHYNSTYVHRSFSFETGLLDALMLLAENEANNILLGGLDDITLYHFQLFDKLGYWKKEDTDSHKLTSSATPGTIAGEGSTYFTLSKFAAENTYCKIKGVFTVYHTDIQLIHERLLEFLKTVNLTPEDINLWMLGLNGDLSFDPIYDHLFTSMGISTATATYKQLCGEYFTASAFAMALGSLIIYHQDVPDYLMHSGSKPKIINHLIIYNQNRGNEHSFILLGK